MEAMQGQPDAYFKDSSGVPSNVTGVVGDLHSASNYWWVAMAWLEHAFLWCPLTAMLSNLHDNCTHLFLHLELNSPELPCMARWFEVLPRSVLRARKSTSITVFCVHLPGTSW